ncbi:hypothetical protein SSX86_003308 [Deinandra increscens subsp. villosa]|uniref:Uncharacterized protein n=1 Tax=Deinandra increscens subsp. villosa TaxID=3103831 RepID=A0AAP0DHE4_9ASTR
MKALMSVLYLNHLLMGFGYVVQDHVSVVLLTLRNSVWAFGYVLFSQDSIASFYTLSISDIPFYFESECQMSIFHYDGGVDACKELEWADSVVHVSAVNQTK